MTSFLTIGIIWANHHRMFKLIARTTNAFLMINILFLLVIGMLFFWRRTTGQIQFNEITTRANEIFYWITILISNTLGTALGDFVATTTGLGFEGGALLFGALIAHELVTVVPELAPYICDAPLPGP